MSAPVSPLQRATVWLDARPLRERLLLSGGALAFAIALWSELLMGTAQSSAQQTRDALEPTRTRIQVLTLEIEGLTKRVKLDPNEIKRQQIATLQHDITSTTSQLAERTAQLIPPDEMAKVMRDLLSRESDLRLLQLDAGHAEAIFENPIPNSSIGRLYKHTLELELTGEYLATLHYLESLEKLPWALLWEGLDYKVTVHPRASIHVTVHSLGAQEEWIGV